MFRWREERGRKRGGEQKKNGEQSHFLFPQFHQQLTASLTARALVALSPAAPIGEGAEPLPLGEDELEAPLGEARARATNRCRQRGHLAVELPLGAGPAAAAARTPRPLVDAAHGEPRAADVEEGSIGNAGGSANELAGFFPRREERVKKVMACRHINRLRCRRRRRIDGLGSGARERERRRRGSGSRGPCCSRAPPRPQPEPVVFDAHGLDGGDPPGRSAERRARRAVSSGHPFPLQRRLPRRRQGHELLRAGSQRRLRLFIRWREQRRRRGGGV